MPYVMCIMEGWHPYRREPMTANGLFESQRLTTQ